MDLKCHYYAPRRIEFRWRRSTLKAVASPADVTHPHVLRIFLIRSYWDELLKALIEALPRSARTWLSTSVYPALFLPDRLILKHAKQDMDSWWERERQAYERLEHLQGSLIPVCYGEVSFGGQRALLLSEVLGGGFLRHQIPPLSKEDFMARVNEAYQPLHDLGLCYGVPELDHFIFVRDKIVLVDLEDVFEVEPQDRERVFNFDREFAERTFYHHRD